MQQLVDNRYEILRTLGSGGMADVFLAHDNVLDRDVALKVMNSRYASDEEFVERFRREAQSAAALSHPNIVSIYDRGESPDGTYYIAMEYLPGGTLKDRILKRGALPPRTAAAVAAQIAEALRAAHDRGVVHRDIKPHNILITSSGDIKVTDFGIARAASSSTMTRTGAVMGTAHYISPEQAMGESVGPASDLYSLGVVLYEMLTGELPFDADTPIGIAMKHVSGNLRPPREVNPNVPAGLNAIVVKLLQKDPKDRYASDSDLIEDLERVQRGETPAGAAQTQAMSRVQRPEPETRAMPVATAQQRKKRRGILPLVALGVVLLALVGFGGYSLLQNLQGPAVNNAPHAQKLAVPDLSGKTLDEARRQVDNRFQIVQGSTQDSPRAEGTILGQDPASGDRLAEGSQISVTTASGRNAVPNVQGSAQDAASQTLASAGFKVRVEQRASDASQAGQVLSQNPGGGSSQNVGSTVTLVVGSGPKMISVPDIPTGSSRAQSESILKNAGLSLGSVTTTPSSDVAKGGIVDQSPNPGTQVGEGSPVNIVLSSGPQQVSVPNVVGRQVMAAQQTLSSAGLGYTSTGVQSDRSAGTVLSTKPGGGTQVDTGSSVEITYSLGPPTQSTTTVTTTSSSAPSQSGASQQNVPSSQDVQRTVQNQIQSPGASQTGTPAPGQQNVQPGGAGSDNASSGKPTGVNGNPNGSQ